ncbi:unnamed protein product [Schistosoma turkestanicum]|nr:unnamed protein product [Schistosoma turkestanicum]
MYSCFSGTWPFSVNSFGLRQFLVTLCTNVKVNSYSNPTITDQQTSIYCPHRTTLQIFDAYYSQVLDKNSECSKSSEYTGNNQKYLSGSNTQFSLMSECYAKSVGQIVKRLCDGTNKCDPVHQLKQENITTCPYPSFLQVNYTCLPVYSKQEVICADSYVELSCKVFSLDMGLIILEAVLNYNLSTQPTSTSETNLQKCSRSNTNLPCPSVDSISIISNKCNGYSTCTVSPNLVLESFYRVNSKKSTLLKQISCAKSYLYLRYTCVHNLLLDNTLRLEDSKNSIKLREKHTFKPKKRVNKSSGNGKIHQKMNDINVMIFNDNSSIYSGQRDVINSQMNSMEHKPKSSSIVINDEILSVLNELSVSPKTKSTHIYLSALLPAVLCIIVSCIFAIAILCHRKQLFKKKLKSNNISRILYNPTYCDRHSTYNVTVDDNNHETVCQSEMQVNHSYSSKPMKNFISEWTDRENFTPYLQSLQQPNSPTSHLTQHCPNCNNEQNDISQLLHYQNILCNDNEIISNNNIVNQSVKANSSSSGRMTSTENSFPLNSPEIITSKMETHSPSAVTCLSHGFINSSINHPDQCCSSHFKHTDSLIYCNFTNCTNNKYNNNNNNRKQTSQQISTLGSNEQENDITPRQIFPLSDRLGNNTKLYYYQNDDLIPNFHAKLHDGNIYEKENNTISLQQKPVSDLSMNASEQQMDYKIKCRLAPPLFSSGDELLPNYMMNTKSPIHLKYGVIPVVRYPYDSEDHLDDSDSDVQKYPQARDSLNFSRNCENKPDVCLTDSKNDSKQKYSLSNSTTFHMLDPKRSQLSRTASDHKVQNPVSPSLIRSVTSQVTNNSVNSFIKISEPLTKTICTIQSKNVLNDAHSSENHMQSSPINIENQCFIYDSNKLSAVNDNHDLSNSMCRSLQP